MIWTDSEIEEPRSVPRVQVDHRERASGITDLLLTSEELEVKETQLTTGDYIINNRIVLERKTLHDLAVSIMDTRLFKQAARLSTSPWRPMLIVEGNRLDISVTRKSINGALIALALNHNIPALRSRDPEETARLIIYCARRFVSLHPRPAPVGRKPKRLATRRLHVLTTLPHVGRHTAKLLLEHFVTVERCMTASEDELCEVDGVGTKTARAIRQVLEAKLE